MKNLSTLETLSANEVSKLTINDLMDLSEQVTKLVSHTKELKTKLNDALQIRFLDSVNVGLKNLNKDTGTINFYDSGFKIIAEVPKKITWNNEKIAVLIDKIPDEIRKCVKISYSIDERQYAQLQPEYQEIFSNARTVSQGSVKIQITLPEVK